MRTLLAPITERGYAYDWTLFERWCVQEGLTSLPATPDTVSLYVTAVLVSGIKISTASRRFWAIRHAHRSAKLPFLIDGEVREILDGAQCLRLETPHQMTPLSLAQIEKIAGSLGGTDTPRAARNRCIVLFGFFSALRRSSLSALMLADIEFAPQGLIVHIRKEKQDQKGEGRMIGLPCGAREFTCPVAAVRVWLKHRGDNPGPLFSRLDRAASPGKRLAPAAIAEVVKTCVSAIGLDRSKFAGHSLRSGFCTAAGEANIGEWLVASQTGHRSMKVLRRYFRRTDLFKANAAGLIGL